MTITPVDRDRVSSDVSPFGVQNELHDDLPNVLRNMLRELSERTGIDGLELSEQVIRDVCDHKQIGAWSLEIHNRLTAELSDYSFEARYKEDLTIEELKEKVEKPEYSYPIVELSQKEYSPEGYQVQEDRRGNSRTTYVLVMAINHDSVLVYDPLKYADNSPNGDIEATEVDKPEFLSAWKGRFETTSSLWVENTDQARLTKFA